jgi:hypothetical protein
MSSNQPSKPPLSTQMRDSWRTGHFWFNYAVRESFNIDAIYWAVLYDGSTGTDLLDDNMHIEMELFTYRYLWRFIQEIQLCSGALPYKYYMIHSLYL